MGAAAAAARLWNLKPDQFAQALAISTTMAAGLQNAFRGMSEIKPLHAGHAADAGFVATGLARSGVLAAKDMFEGDTGLGRAMSVDVAWTAAIGAADEFTILRTTVKNHGCCGHIFAALDGALALKTAHDLDVSDIASVRVGGYSATVNVTGNYIAETPAAAKFCLPFIVASGLVHGDVRLNAYSPERLGDPVVRDLMPRVVVALDPDVDALFPEQRSAKVWMTLNDGTELFHHQPHRIGDPDLPLSDAQLDAKFTELTSGALAEAAAKQLLETLWELDARQSVADLYAPLPLK